jgi:hypothetical protein
VPAVTVNPAGGEYLVAGAKLTICKNNTCADAQCGQTATPRTIGLQSISTYDVLIVTG